MSDNYAEQRLQEYVGRIPDDKEEDVYVQDSNPQPSKYHRRIFTKNGWTDVYDILNAFDISNPALAHAIKKMLCAGTRGYKDFYQDIQEAIDSLERAKDFPPVPF